jgi:hypothetical protein
MPKEIEVPAAPAGLPKAVEKKWKETYAAAFKEAQDESPDDLTQQRQLALRDANRILKTPEITSYKQAMEIEDWHFVLREPSANRETLRVVTRHGKKYTFAIPKKEQKPAEDKKPGGAASNGNGGSGTGEGTATT